ncbi:MAG: superoxide dismutase [Acidobacteria bacterium]|nr:MAG: superoxide dismutase [Acidobacteriota bacterium]
MQNKSLFVSLLIAGAFLSWGTPLRAHCQVPCGIYDDYARVISMLEDASTVEKAIKSMTALAGKTDVQSQNQMVRWVVNKEAHAENIIATIANYFLTQRVKTSQKDYVERLKKHHQVILLAMKAKQTVDPKVVAELKSSIEALKAYYPKTVK